MESIFTNPHHPFTRCLLHSFPDVDDPSFELEAIPGSLPNLNEEISGCRFHLRCPFATSCKAESSKEYELHSTHRVK
ncbi:oligopeptide/dipeptide ABC transporter ATP-binding protein [Niallia sp. MER TA 168]|uniref:oligopeptide/dipeptide ABC transporter ATP-binding protein n=1 Tax=Niallia sp. MER TA 168 TaxID=2939568 RepID=UPI0037C7D807